MVDMPKHYKCYYCGIEHYDVEAGGIWACPNILCSGPGAAWWRHTLKSYREIENDCHTIDEHEAIVEANKYLETCKDPVIKEAIKNSLIKLSVLLAEETKRREEKR